MKRKAVLKDKSPCHNEQRDRQLALLLKIIDDNTKLSSGEIMDMLYESHRCNIQLDYFQCDVGISVIVSGDKPIIHKGVIGSH